MAQACAGRAEACTGTPVPDREQVTGSPAGDFQANWRWLNDAIAAAKTASAADRAKAMEAVRAHLTELATEAGPGEREPAADFGKARAAANAALARPEFRSVDEPSWLERQTAKIQDWILKLFAGMDGLGKRAPWLAPLIEWSCFALAAAGLLWFVRQSLARQALRISLADSAALGLGRNRDSVDWSTLAEQRAAAGDWREAVHCLYWAAIALMEGRRAWKPNPTRTPREYLGLLQPGSEGQRALRALTRSFETIWYGRAEVDEAAYRNALESFRSLEAARPERFTPSLAEGTPTQPALLTQGSA